MSRIIYGVVTFDPVTGHPNAINADIEWNLGDAAVVADALGGEVYQAPRGEWSATPAVAVARALAATKDDVMEHELKKILDAGEGGDGS